MNKPLAAGLETLRRALATMPESPGVYRMLDAAGEPLYVGKAKNLKKRVTSYANVGALSHRLKRMVAGTASLEVVTTKSEVEALLLESNLIKRLKPHYNIVLRDDKSFPYILITGGHAYARITKYRGAKSAAGEYFGPFASAGAVNQTVNALHRAFPLRSCSDSIFAGRTRPCLQHQIKRCAAPCVGRIGESAYATLVDEAREFLSGRSQHIKARLTERMTAASEALEFETAAAYRDRIRALAHIQARQGINLHSLQDADVAAIHQSGGQSCVQIFFFRGGQNFGNRAYYPRHQKEVGGAEVLRAFIGQFYNNRTPPPLLLVNRVIEERELVEEALSLRAERRVRIHRPSRGDKSSMVVDAERNAREALARRFSESAAQRKMLEGLADKLELDGVPERIEVYDNSHISGTDAVGAMIAAGPEGFIKKAYRKFNIQSDAAPLEEGGISAGDDYGMMREVLSRRFSRLLKEDPERAQGAWPDLVLIDGGAGQLSAARDIFAELGVSDVALAAVAKGPDRNAGLERIFLPDAEAISLQRRDPVLYFIQRLRDEAHRFAIGTHRARRARGAARSRLDAIQGVGPSRKKALLHHFGSARGVSQAGLADLERVHGISGALARSIYDHFHANA
ncbi:MAG: excinuclease ABC subunit UvrC [Alphaproteobacteria bacterium]|nr:excinuclease ABC subunit UvrC [Alphaproteobacteria bacterium]